MTLAEIETLKKEVDSFWEKANQKLLYFLTLNCFIVKKNRESEYNYILNMIHHEKQVEYEELEVKAFTQWETNKQIYFFQEFLNILL
jgi:hypothetical protein